MTLFATCTAALILAAVAERPCSDPIRNNLVFVDATESRGTAFLLRHGGAVHLVTAYHVVRSSIDTGAEPCFLVGEDHDQELRGVHLVRADRRLDLAVYSIDLEANGIGDGAGLEAAPEVGLGDEVRLAGYPARLAGTLYGNRMRVVRGCVASEAGYKVGSRVEYLDLDLPGTDHGHSGGPVLTEAGEVAGVAVLRLSSSISPGVRGTFAVPVRYVLALVDGREIPLPERLRQRYANVATVFGVARYDDGDRDLWMQRFDLHTGRKFLPESGRLVTTARTREACFVPVQLENGDTLLFHEVESIDRTDIDIAVRRIGLLGECEFLGEERGLAIAATPRIERAPAAVPDGCGGAVVVFEEHGADGEVDLVAVALDASGQSGDALRIGEAGVAEFAPATVSADDGEVLVAYLRSKDDRSVELVAQRLSVHGSALHAGVVHLLADSVPSNRVPVLVTDGAGGAMAVFVRGGAYARPFVLRLAGDGSALWSESTRVADAALSGGGSSLAVCADGRGGVFVAFSALSDLASTRETDVVLQRITPDGIASWGRAGAGVRAAGTGLPESHPAIAADEAGGVVLTWQIALPNGDVDIGLDHFDPRGRSVTGGLAPPVRLAAAHYPEQHPRIVGCDGRFVAVAFEVVRGDVSSIGACLFDIRGHQLVGGMRLWSAAPWDRSSVVLDSTGDRDDR